MEEPVIDDNLIREYLLGRVDDDQEMVDRFDEQLISNPEFSMSVDIVEDEIIEEYLEGSLSAEDRHAVERHFLRPPERQRKLRNARLLRHHLATTSTITANQSRAENQVALTAPKRVFPFPSTRA